MQFHVKNLPFQQNYSTSRSLILFEKSVSECIGKICVENVRLGLFFTVTQKLALAVMLPAKNCTCQCFLSKSIIILSNFSCITQKLPKTVLSQKKVRIYFLASSLCYSMGNKLICHKFSTSNSKCY